MPTPLTSELPRPKSWDEFEAIVLDLFKKKWNDENAHLEGRHGQEQKGVDVWGQPNELAGGYVGVQCKRYEDGKVTQDVVRGEISKAEKFQPPLTRYSLVTTSSRDARLQESIRLLNKDRRKNNLFLVDILFWEDLCAELTDPVNWDLLRKYYGEWFRVFETIDQHKVQGEIVRIGLQALMHLMEIPEVRAAVVISQTELRTISEFILKLSVYKKLHDLFQDLEIESNQIIATKKLLPREPSAWLSLTLQFENSTKIKLEGLLKVVEANPFAGKASLWVKNIQQVQDDFQKSIDDSDYTCLVNASLNLQQVLDTQPTRINVQLVTFAGFLHLDELGNTLQKIHRKMLSLEIESDKVNDVGDGILALAKIATVLESLVQNHNLMQEIDDELRRIEGEVIGEEAKISDSSWKDIEQITIILCEGIFAERRQDMQGLCEEMRASRAGSDQDKTTKLFIKYRSRISQRFRQVDDDLLHLTDEIKGIGDKLSELLETLQESKGDE